MKEKISRKAIIHAGFKSIAGPTKHLLFGLLKRHECLIPTWRGLFLLVLIVLTLAFSATVTIHPFLAGADPVEAEVLVVEGWMSDYALEEVKVEFEKNHYRKLFVTGGPLESGSHLSEYSSYAHLGAATLIRMGVSASEIQAIPSPSVLRDRT